MEDDEFAFVIDLAKSVDDGLGGIGWRRKDFQHSEAVGGIDPNAVTKGASGVDCYAEWLGPGHGLKSENWQSAGGSKGNYSFAIILSPLQGLFLCHILPHGLRRGLHSDAASRLKALIAALKALRHPKANSLRQPKAERFSSLLG